MIKEDPVNPSEYDTSITCQIFPQKFMDYGSYYSGLPSFHDMLNACPDKIEELKEAYAVTEEFSKWAIEMKICWACRFPWTRQRCICENHNSNRELTDRAIVAANKILDCQAQLEKKLADKIAEDLTDETSLYSQMNRAAAEIKRNVDAQKANIVGFVHPPFYKAVWQKDSWVRWFKKLRNLCSIDYLRWKFRGVIKGKKVVSIPLDMADSKIIEDASFGVGNVCIKTKGGSVVVVPSSMVERMKKNYSGGSIVAPMSKE